MSDIAAIKARADKATAGPWELSPHSIGKGGWISGEHGSYTDIVINAGTDRALTNADFIAHARTDIPALIAALEASEADRVKAEQERDAAYCCDGCGGNWTLSELKDGGHVSCCPERKMLSAKEWRDKCIALEQERDGYRSKLMQLADATEVSGMSWSGFNVLGDKKSIKAVQSAVHYAGQIEEYRTAFADRLKQMEQERDADMKRAYIKGRTEWCPAGILDDTERTERDWQSARSAFEAKS